MDTQYPTLPYLTEQDITRFWSHISIKSEAECWLWGSSTFRRGYGQFKAQGRNLRAPRVAFLLTQGVDPVGYMVCHTCDNPLCCNGNHLFIGTGRDNYLDCVSKDRTNFASGSRHGSRTQPESRARGEAVKGSRLTAFQVSAIREERRRTGATHKELAVKYSVARKTISKILNRETWKHLN